jgi:hypothetical protein
MTWPRVVAESLRQVRRPVDVAVPGAVLVSPEHVVAAVRQRARPDRSSLPVPAMLYRHQHDPWRRVMAALDQRHGALLAESVGQGKTWIALAAAAVTPGRPIALIPAILRQQWLRAAATAGVPLQLFSHELASRGRVPPGDPSLVIIDEAHRFRDPSTRRFETIAPWLLGRKCLLLTATPIVNRVDDLIALLRLVLPEDSLALDGIAALGDLGASDVNRQALRRVVIRSAPAAPDSRRIIAPMEPDAAEETRGVKAVATIDALQLSAVPAVRQLLRSVLLDAAASSDAALSAALRRYRALLLQSRDAGGTTRTMLRHFAGDALDQLVLWSLLSPEPAIDALPLDDLAPLDRIITLPLIDHGWISRLRARCADALPTVLFTRHRATADLLRNELAQDVAWVSGSGAGIGPHRMARDIVLDAFGPRRDQWCGRKRSPRMLVATDVAAEGLDLFAAGRIVHVDLPWTATRVDQREGRLLRLGQQHRQVEIVVRRPSAALETILGPEKRVGRKRALTDRWLGMLEHEPSDSDVAARDPVVAWTPRAQGGGELAAVELTRGKLRGVVVLQRTAAGTWQVAPSWAVPVLVRESRPVADVEVSPGGPDAAPRTVGAVGAAVTAATATGALPPADLMLRIHRLARNAAAQRDHRSLERLDRLLRFLARAPSLGGKIRLQQLRTLSDSLLLRAPVPDLPPLDPLRAMLFAAILYRSPE